LITPPILECYDLIPVLFCNHVPNFFVLISVIKQNGCKPEVLVTNHLRLADGTNAEQLAHSSVRFLKRRLPRNAE
jgi:hypothetical protein